jgi:glycosyltransferase involved in cell wall biosynthesis
MKKRICILSFSYIIQDGRVLRQIEYLSREYGLLVVGYGPPHPKFSNKTNIHWVSLPWQSKLRGTGLRLVERFFTIPFWPQKLQAYRILLDKPCDAYHANNWDSLPPAALAAKEVGARLVLDLHDDYASWYWGLNVPLIKMIFTKYSSQVDASTAAAPGYIDRHSSFGLHPTLVVNAPQFVDLSSRKHPNPANIRLIYHGLASKSRHPDVMIKAIAMADQRYSLSFMFINKDSSCVAELRQLADKLAPGRVTFINPVAPDEIVKRISEFDIGFFPLKPVNINYSLTFPNKLFDYIMAGLAVSIGPSIGMSQILRQYNCGVIASSFQPQDIAASLNQTTVDQWAEMQQASLRAARVLNAETELSKVLKIYRDLFSN